MVWRTELYPAGWRDDASDQAAIGAINATAADTTAKCARHLAGWTLASRSKAIEDVETPPSRKCGRDLHRSRISGCLSRWVPTFPTPGTAASCHAVSASWSSAITRTTMPVKSIYSYARMVAEHFDVIIVGAGLSGIGAAHHLQDKCPDKSYAILEARADLGGTWDLFRYPGVRSDSDMFTLGYRLRPWAGAKVIAGGPSILGYVRDTARVQGIDRHIRFGHRVVRASWCTDTATWTVHIRHGSEDRRLTCNFLYCCGGYYRYDQGYTPTWPGMDQFQGKVVHPQHWPDDLDYRGKRVVVIGSGATAVTLVPAMADTAAHVTMLQRSPSYVLSVPGEDPIADLLRRILPARAAFGMVRWKNVLISSLIYQLSRRRPKATAKFLRGGVVRQVPEGFDTDKHFAPRYNPWDQRLCLVPDGDLFKALTDGIASIATEEIEAFTASGIRLASGRNLEADIIVTATGLNLLAIGGMRLEVDGTEIALPDTMAYKAMMLTGVPNFAFAVGYTNASWTLKVDLTSEYVCRLLKYLDERNYRSCVPVRDPGVQSYPLLDFQAGYVLRSLDQFPRQGSEDPWRVSTNYLSDIRVMRRGSVTDGMEFSPRSVDSAFAAPANADR